MTTEGPIVVVITGPPGAGKSSALMRVVTDAPEMGRFSVRDYGLELAERGDPLGDKIGPILRRRERLPDDLVQAEFAQYLRGHRDVHRVALSESYPRGEQQCLDAESVLAEMRGRMAGLICLQAPDDVVRTRVRRRLTCDLCGCPQESAAERRCEYCPGWAARRPDDEPGTFDDRLRRYRREATEIERFYRGRGAMVTIDATEPHPVVAAGVLAAIGDLVVGSAA
jgi:adenylate kinase